MPDKKTREEIAIEVKNVSKSFTVYYDRANSFKERILFLGRNKKKEKREILKDINLTIKKGEVVGRYQPKTTPKEIERDIERLLNE